MTSNQDEAMQWLARSLGWERSLERIRHSALADAATAGMSAPPVVADEPVVVLEPAAGADAGEPVGGPERTHVRRQSETHGGQRPRSAGVWAAGEGTPAGVRRSA